MEGIEPTRLSALVPKTSVAASYTTSPLSETAHLPSLFRWFGLDGIKTLIDKPLPLRVYVGAFDCKAPSNRKAAVVFQPAHKSEPAISVEFELSIHIWSRRRESNPHGCPHAPQACASAISATSRCYTAWSWQRDSNPRLRVSETPVLVPQVPAKILLFLV